MRRWWACGRYGRAERSLCPGCTFEGYRDGGFSLLLLAVSWLSWHQEPAPHTAAVLALPEALRKWVQSTPDVTSETMSQKQTFHLNTLISVISRLLYPQNANMGSRKSVYLRLS